MKSTLAGQSSNKSRSSSERSAAVKKKDNGGFADNRSETEVQKELSRLANESPVVSQQKAYQQMANGAPNQNAAPVQNAASAAPVQFVKNNPVKDELRTPHVKFPKGQQGKGKAKHRRRMAQREERAHAELDEEERIADVDQAIDQVNDLQKQHIMVKKHAWKKIFPGFIPSNEQKGTFNDGSWGLVKWAIREVLLKGEAAAIGPAFIKTFTVYGKEVQVTYRELAAGTRVGDAWVKTRDYGPLQRADR